MCIMCGITTCGASINGAAIAGIEAQKAALGTPDAPYAYFDLFNNGVDDAVKWGTDRFGASGGTVTYSLNLIGINSLTSGAALLAFERLIELAFLTWASVANINFVETTSGRGMIDISTGGADVDPVLGSPFGVLGFATFNSIDDVVSNNTVLFDEVEIVFDNAEVWSSTGGSIDFFAVALHEIGHALGMGHVPNVSDGGTLQNMNPFLSTDELQGGDIAGISTLYGDREWGNGRDVANFTKVNAAQTIFARGGNDSINGSDLGDNIYGGAGNDELFGNGGNDLIVDTRGNNDISGGDNNDTIIGGGGTLNAQGNAGSDRLIGGIGNDTLDGGSGNDSLRGDPAGSFISGDDRLIAGSGNDWLEGGGGADVFVFSRTSGDNRIGTLDLSGGGRQIVGQDFEISVDDIDLQAFDLDWAGVQSRLSTDGNGNTVFTFNSGPTQFTLTIEDILHTDLTSGDFIL